MRAAMACVSALQRQTAAVHVERRGVRKTRPHECSPVAAQTDAREGPSQKTVNADLSVRNCQPFQSKS